MRELVIEHEGGSPVLRQGPARFQARPGQAVVQVLAAAINPVDRKMAAAATTASGPRGLGAEAIVEWQGHPCYANRAVPPHGTIADHTLVVTDLLVPVPDGLDPALALAAGIPGLAAWFGLTRAARLKAGETVLVLGATGAVGRIGVQVARLLGAASVIAVGRRRDVLDELRDFGSLLALDDLLRGAVGSNEVDIVLDMLFSAPLEAALSALRPGGRSVTIGSSAGAAAVIPSAALMGRSLLSHRNSDASPGEKRDAFLALAGYLSRGVLVSPADIYPLDDAEAAWKAAPVAAGHRTVVIP